MGGINGNSDPSSPANDPVYSWKKGLGGVYSLPVPVLLPILYASPATEDLGRHSVTRLRRNAERELPGLPCRFEKHLKFVLEELFLNEATVFAPV